MPLAPYASMASLDSSAKSVNGRPKVCLIWQKWYDQVMISVVLATHNEAKNLAACLEAVKDLYNELIIADGESSDDTVAIAQKFGAQIIATTNKANFHINKQLAMDAAKGDVVLQLDGDEVVDTELKTFIRELHQKVLAGKYPASAADAVAWYIPRKNFFMNRFLSKGGQYPDAVIRLYLKGKARLPQIDVHEQMAVDGSTGWASGHLLHYSNPTFADYWMKFQRYTSFKAGQLADQKIPRNLTQSLNYLLVKPSTTFFSIYLRHKGFVDGIPGFLFALMSGLHHSVAYAKYIDLANREIKTETSS